MLFYRELGQDRAFERAGALAYGTLVSMVPLLMLMYAVLNAAGLLQRDARTVELLVFGTFLGDIPEVRDVLLPGLQGINLGAIGAIGTIGWLYISARIYMVMEEAYSDIFKVPVDRPLWRRLVNFYLAITGGPVVVGLGLFGSLELADRWGATWWDDAVGWTLPVALLVVAIRALPCTTVRWGPALVGGATSGVLIALGAYAFAWYVQTFASTDPIIRLYGSIGIIPVFLFWLWLLWVFVLLGVEVAHVAQDFPSLVRAEEEQRRAESERGRMPSVETAIEVAATVAWYFQHGRAPVSEDEIAQRCHLPPHRVGSVVAVLEQGAILTRAAPGWTMTRPPADISVGTVVEVWRTATTLRRQGGDPLTAHLASVLKESLAGSLADASERWVDAERQPEAAPPDGPPIGPVH
jgi:membrane protein